MAYEFKQGEKVRAGLRRIAVERIDKAIATIEGARSPDASRKDVDAAVHDARKRCKELRALVRLVRPSFDAYQRENAEFRTAAQMLADLRDATTVLEAFDALVDQPDAERFAPVRAALATERTEEAADADERLAGFLERMTDAGGRARKWTLGDRDFDAIGPGLEKTYAGCRDAMARARDETTTDNLHEWRKRVKYNRSHLRLLRGLFKPVIEPVREQAKQLSDLLGDEHDLAVLAGALRESDADAELVDELIAHAKQRRKALRAEAFALGARLYAQPPADYARHAARLWRVR
ncbi:MAG: CHAD domain-containing protein [Pseudomonadales bacterium]